jgi:hypothetical protein
MTKQEANDKFDRCLRFYQKFGTALFLPSLAGLFSLAVNAIGGLSLSALVPGYCQLVRSYAGIDGWILALIGSAYFFAALALTIFLAKGKVWCLYVQLGLFVADFATLFFLIGRITPVDLVLGIVWHVLFLGVGVTAIVFAIKAQRLLNQHGDWILGK